MEYVQFLLLVFSGTLFAYNKVEGLKVEEIVDGQEADTGSYKFVVALLFKPHINGFPDQVACTGVIVDDWYIATIADCFFDARTGGFINTEFYICASITNVHLSSPTVYHRLVHYIIIHRGYQPFTNNTEANLALVKLIRPFGLRRGHPYVRKLKTSLDPNLRVNTEYSVAGFGWNKVPPPVTHGNYLITHQQLVENVGKLRFEKAYILDVATCYSKMGFVLPKSHMCVQINQLPDERKGICRGDSGAPLVYSRVVKGLAINGFADCNENNIPAVYLNLAYYDSFINDTVLGNVNNNMRIYELTKARGFYEFQEV